MLSRISKMSVFGIVAFMLAFGLAATDALAANGEVTVSVTGADDLRAAATDNIVFTVNVGTAPTGDQAKVGNVTITIPAGWSRPVTISGDTGDPPDGTIDAGDLNDPGEVFITNGTGTGDGAATGRISGRSFIATFGKTATGSVTFAYRSVNPHRSGTYGFALSTQYHDIEDTDTDAIMKRGGVYYLDISVGPVDSGAGKVTLARSSGGPFLQPKPNDKILPHEGFYLLVSEESLADLRITFEAAGTMPKGSTIVLTPTGWTFEFDDDRGSAVSGHVDLGRTSTALTATVKDGGIQKGSKVVFTLKRLKAPKIEGATAEADTDNEIGVQTTVLAADTATTVADAPFRFIVTKKAGSIKAALQRPAGTAISYVISGSETADTPDGSNLVFAFSELAGVARGAKYEIEIPTGLPMPYKSLGSATEDGATNAGREGRKLVGEFVATAEANANSVYTAGDTIPPVTYRLRKAPAEGAYTFTIKVSEGPHVPLTNIASPTLEVIGGHGKGTMTLTKNGAPFTQTSSEAEVGDLVFTYTPGGRMAVGAVVEVSNADGWSLFRTDNGDGVSDRGEVMLAGDKATLNVAIAGDMFTATTTKVLTPSDRLVFTYKNVKVPKTGPRSDTFETQTQSHPGTDLLADIAASPNVGIGRAADGTGSLAVNVTQADAGSSIGDLVFTFTAAGTMSVGSTVEITIPDSGGWPAPNTDVSQPGGVTLGDTISASLATTATTMSATIATELSDGGTIVFTYKNITAPTSGGQYTFTGKSTSSAIGTLRPLAAGVTISIDEVSAGSIMLADASGILSSAAPGMALGNLNFTFTAGAQMAPGAQVQITIPTGWTTPFIDNNDGVDAAGEVSVAGMADLSVSGGGAQPWMLTATTTATLEIGNTLVIAYKQVTAPATEETYQFLTKSSVASGGTSLPLSSQPSVIVRTPVAAIAVHAMPESVFAGDDVTITVDLWSAGGELAKALGSMVVMLDDGDAEGSFTDADGNAVTSVTIADNTSSAMATYMNAAAGMVTITATSGEMTDTADVEIKSTIRELSVNGETEMALVKQGSTIMVRATGPSGGGTVVVEDSDGEKVGLKVGLDPIGEPDADGDQQYGENVDLPDVLADGMYTVVVEIQGDENRSLQIQVLNNQADPVVDSASVLPSTVMNGDLITLSVKAMSSSDSNPIVSVMADVSALDSEQTDMIMLSMQAGTADTYFAVHTISMDNANDDGVVDVTFTATDMIGGEGTDTASVTLENDDTEITAVNVPTDMFRPGDTVTITATGTAGRTATFSIATGAHEVKVDKMKMTEGPDGTYTGSFMVVADVFPEGTYYVTVNLNTKSLSQTGLNIGPAGYEFTLMIPKGTHAIHVPLAVNMINGEEGTIETVGDLYDALGDAVNFIISFIDGTPVSYLGDESAGSMADAAIGDDTGLIAVMKDAATLALVGDALGTGGVSQISVAVGNNLVGVPLDPAVDMMISDALVPGVEAIAFSNAAGDGFDSITPTDTSADGPLMGGVGYVVVASAAGSIPIVGTAWENDGAMMAAPAVAFSGSQTPVLHVNGGLLDEFDMMSRIPELRVTVKNLSTGASLDTVLGTELSESAYSGTFVEFSRHAAKAGDVLEITAHSPSPYVGVRPVPQIVVSAEEVLTSRISLPDLELYEIPSETELLANFPNPFNPETWIPYRLAKAAKVSLEIYDTNGSLVRSIDVGFKPAAVYESRASAIYWDGRNNYGERVASGTYFYHLTAGEDYASTRRMVILK